MGTRPDLLEQSVAAEGFTLDLELGVLLEHPFVQPLELGRGIDAELVGQHLAHTLECRERVGLTTRSVERQDELLP